MWRASHEANAPRTRSAGRPARGAQNPHRPHAREPGTPATACPAPPPIEATAIADLVSVDFFVVPTATFRVLYVFVVLLHRRRQVAHFNVTDSPTAAGQRNKLS